MKTFRGFPGSSRPDQGGREKERTISFSGALPCLPWGSLSTMSRPDLGPMTLSIPQETPGLTWELPAAILVQLS
eukprot:869091-Amphidinium_carterae.1